MPGGTGRVMTLTLGVDKTDFVHSGIQLTSFALRILSNSSVASRLTLFLETQPDNWSWCEVNNNHAMNFKLVFTT